MKHSTPENTIYSNYWVLAILHKMDMHGRNNNLPETVFTFTSSLQSNSGIPNTSDRRQRTQTHAAGVNRFGYN